MIRKILAVTLAGAIVGLAACAQPDGSATADVLPGDGSPGPAAGLQLPRSVDYAGLTWTITAATYLPAAEGEEPTVQLDLAVNSSLDGIRVTYPASILALAAPDGSLTRAEHFLAGPDDTERRLEVGPGESVETTLVFEVAGEIDLSAVSFTIDAEDQEPAVLPLSGEVPGSPYPREGTASGQSGPLRDASVLAGLVIVEALTATAALDHAELRAPRGMMFVIVGVRFTAAEGQRRALVDDRFFRLRVGDDVVQPAQNIFEEANPGAWIELELAFPVPVDATDMTLAAGYQGADDATFPVSVPPAG
jgi:hypothetical protein